MVRLDNCVVVASCVRPELNPLSFGAESRFSLIDVSEADFIEHKIEGMEYLDYTGAGRYMAYCIGTGIYKTLILSL